MYCILPQAWKLTEKLCDTLAAYAVGKLHVISERHVIDNSV